jgi:hypothetical protein
VVKPLTPTLAPLSGGEGAKRDAGAPLGSLPLLNGHSTGTSAGAPLVLIKTTRNFAGSVLLAFRSTR